MSLKDLGPVDIKPLGLGLRKKLGPEALEQIAVIDWFDIQHPKIKKLLFHIPNEAKSSKIAAYIKKRMGMRSGACDLFLAMPNKDYPGLFIEMKSKSGRLTSTQVEFMYMVKMQGYHAVKCNSADEAITTIKQYLETCFNV